ncbi:hypothetical protein [Vibrio intestinalis]|uniref:hypothetical protein n=1 Tax=Vibrio intestinalis TaxID=2933291 RepID=UPI0021A56028|nr:hypothetical protein [Vibrio intestinalis]
MKKHYLIATTAAIAVAGWCLFPAESHTGSDSLTNVAESPVATANKSLGNTNHVKNMANSSYDASNSEAEKEANNSEQPSTELLRGQDDPTLYSLVQTDWQSQTVTINSASSLSIDIQSNQKPTINTDAQYRIQNEIDKWTLTAGSPISYSINIADLFEDKENDLLSTRAIISNGDLKLSGSGSLLSVTGIPSISARQQQLSISATDNQAQDNQWVTAQFLLPSSELPIAAISPLEGDILYRLETTQNFAGHPTYYEVVYCEAFKFTNHEVYFAAATNKTRCPEVEELELIGHYEVQGDNLKVTSQRSAFDAQQTWIIKKSYDSAQHQGVTNYFVTVHDGQHYESYTIQKHRASMERRINGITGQYPYQYDWLDYLIPINSDEYLLTQVGNYIFDHKPDIAGPNGETTDSDLNIQTSNQSLRCHQIAHLYQNGVLGGQGKYGIEIISTTTPSDPSFNIDCLEYVSNPSTGQTSLAFDLTYSPFDEFVPGEVYSYILKPKPQFADRIEELKINLTYSEKKP